MAKVAVELERVSGWQAMNAARGRTIARKLAEGEGWSVDDVLCTRGPQDRPFEETHSRACIAVVVAGSFQYRSSAGRELMTPGSILLGNAGQRFECGHEHGTGDRCLSFHYAWNHFEELAAAAGVCDARPVFHVPRLPPLRALSPLVAQASAALTGSVEVSWEELSVKLTAQTIRLVAGLSTEPKDAPPAALARVTRVVRMIERYPESSHKLKDLAREAGLSTFHFLRTFESLTGATPHQYLLRVRLRRAAIRVSTEPTKILDIALDCGFGDVSNFIRTFRAEFGVSPRMYRPRTRRNPY
ncbi:MAG TPA: AraC family transcriptional regulator [Candidatus Acidoferrum sp.]|nr:AraC family transcriptional regulator [Candidatus Acidoferrum sp.]